MDYQERIKIINDQASDHAEIAKEAIMSYPYYSDEIRKMWIDAIDESIQVRETALQNAKDALNNVFGEIYEQRLEEKFKQEGIK